MSILFEIHLASPQAGNTSVVVGAPREIRPGRVLDIAVHEGSRHPDIVFFLCHGGGGNKNQFRQQWLALSHAGYSVVEWDFPGHGASPKPRDPAVYRAAELLEDYRAVVAAYRRRYTVLVGHSYGGVTTLRLLQALEREGTLGQVDQVVLLGTPYPGAGRALPLLKLPLFVLNLIKPWLAGKFRALAWDLSASPQLVAYEESVARGNPIYVFRAMLTQSEPFDTQRLAQVHVPVQVFAGVSDGLAPPEHAHALVAGLPLAQLHLLSECGHQIMLEKPLAVSRLLLDLAIRAEA